MHGDHAATTRGFVRIPARPDGCETMIVHPSLTTKGNPAIIRVRFIGR
jgi:hypothetical protein